MEISSSPLLCDMDYHLAEQLQEIEAICKPQFVTLERCVLSKEKK
jgi:hypothetical protein